MKGTHGNGCRGFSLIELLGVLAIIGILGAVAYPSVIRRMDMAAKERERIDLASVSNALVLRILSTRTVPVETAWPAEAAAWAQLPVNKITHNARRRARALLIDTSGWFGTTTLPYVQTNTGTRVPSNARALIVSSISRPLPALPARPSASDFNILWNTPRDARPGITAFNTWVGRGEDLVIQRISLDPLFHRLVLINRDPLSAPTYAIGANQFAPWSLLPPTNAFLNGTELTLGTPDGTAQKRVLLTKDESFAFGGVEWGEDFFGPDTRELLGQDFAIFASEFLKRPAPLSAQQGANTQGPVVGMFNFMFVYSRWAGQCPQHFPQYGAPNKFVVPEYKIMLDIGGDGISSFLNAYTGPGGLLK